MHSPCAGGRILSVGSRRYGNLAGHSGKGAGEIVVGVMVCGIPGRSVKGHRNRVQNRVEGVGNSYIVRRHCSRIPQILNDKGVGDLAVLSDCGGREGFADGQHCSVRGIDSLAHLNIIGDSRTGDGCRICDGAGGVQRGILVHICLVNQGGIAACGNADSADFHGRPGRYFRSGLECAVYIVPDGAGHISQRISGIFSCGDSAQIIGYSKPGKGHGTGIDDTDDISYIIICGIGILQSRLF